MSHAIVLADWPTSMTENDPLRLTRHFLCHGVLFVGKYDTLYSGTRYLCKWLTVVPEHSRIM